MNAIIESESPKKETVKDTRLPVLVILSGGMDSTVLAYYAATAKHLRLAGCVSINYGQRHAKELSCAIETTRHRLKVPHHYVDLTDLSHVLTGSSLTDWDHPVPEGHYEEDTMKATVVPNRNMILLALATGVAIANGVKAVAYGAHSGDHAIYPDCRDEFGDAMRKAMSLCHYEPIQLLTPFVRRTKAEIVQLGMNLKVPFANTWSCYKGGDVACGRCGTCVERLEAFYKAGFQDPIEYEDRAYWRTVTH